MDVGVEIIIMGFRYFGVWEFQGVAIILGYRCRDSLAIPGFYLYLL